MKDLLLFDIKPKQRPPVEEQPAQYDRISDIDKKRYILHKRLGSEYNIDANAWTVLVPYPSFNDIPVGPRYYVRQLMRLGYTINYSILSHDELRNMERTKPDDEEIGKNYKK